MSKSELIDKITDFHPASSVGINRGLSYYTGGMADTGDWYYKKLLKLSIPELSVIHGELVEEYKPKPPRVLNEEEVELSKQTILLPNGGFINGLMALDMEKFFLDFENNIMFERKL